MILRDVDYSGNMRHRADATYYHLTDAQFSTVAIIDDNAVVQERVTYSAYGVARHHWPPDVDGDGDVDSTDTSIISTIASGGENAIGEDDYRAEADLNRDGIVNSADGTIATSFGAKAALRYGDLTSPGTPSGSPPGSGIDNTIGFDGYVFNSEAELYTVRFRWFSPELGRWLERDPAGYVDGASLYAAYFALLGVAMNDPYGLDVTRWYSRPADRRIEGWETNAIRVILDIENTCRAYCDRKTRVEKCEGSIKISLDWLAIGVSPGGDPNEQPRRAGRPYTITDEEGDPLGDPFEAPDAFDPVEYHRLLREHGGARRIHYILKGVFPIAELPCDSHGSFKYVVYASQHPGFAMSGNEHDDAPVPANPPNPDPELRKFLLSITKDHRIEITVSIRPCGNVTTESIAVFQERASWPYRDRTKEPYPMYDKE